MPIVYTNVFFERLNDEGKNQLQTAIDEGEEAFNERFGFGCFWEELEIDIFRCGTRDYPPLKAIAKMITWLATADKDVVARLVWEDDEYSFFGCAVYTAYYDEGAEPEFACDACDGEEYYFDFDTHCLPLIKQKYAKEIKKAGLNPDSDEYENQEAFEEWISKENIDSETINEVQYNATQEEISYYLTHTFKQYPEGDWDRVEMETT